MIFKNLHKILLYSELIKVLIGRDLKLRYKNSVLGYAWTWLEPLALMGIFIVVFDMLFKSGVKNFPVFLLCGLIPFTFFQNTISQSVNSITGNAGLIKRVYYPREIFPLTMTLSNGVNMFLSFMVLIPVVLAFGIPITPKMLLFPVITLFLLFFTLGLGLVFATLNVYMRDIQTMVPLILRVWFFATPIFYAVENKVPDKLLNIYMFVNPLAVLITLFRASFMNYTIPKFMHIAVAFVVSTVMFLTGYAFFKKNEDLMVKRI